MNKFKQTAVALVAAGLLSAQAYANPAQAEHLPATQPAAPFVATDLDTLFDHTGQTRQLAVLSAQEMQETQGAYGSWGAAIGGLSGLAGYTTSHFISGSDWSWADAAYATAGGVIAGATAGPTGLVWGFNASIALGSAHGVTKYYGW